jgi:hypothetical protein
MWEDKRNNGKISFKTYSIRRDFQGQIPELQQEQRRRRRREGAGGARKAKAVGRLLLIDWGTSPQITTFYLWKRKYRTKVTRRKLRYIIRNL